MDWSRRRVLALAGATGLAGCIAPSDPATGEESTPTETVTPVEDDDYDLSVAHDVESWSEYAPDWSAPAEAPPTEPEVETVIEGLEIPWDLAFAPNGDLFVSGRVGNIARFAADDLERVAAPDVLDRADAIAPGEEGGWWAGGSEGGLLGIAVHPNYPDVPLVYAIYTQEADGGHRNRVVYYDVSADDPTASETVVVDDIPGHRIIHNGARIAFGPANYLWITTGEGGTGANAQDPASLGGKLLRVEPDGSAPADNPDLGDGADGRIYTLGHRNPQGVSWLPDATTVATEHGPAGGDEIDHIEAGANYGWPEVRREGEYAGTGYHPPLVNTGRGTGWAPSGSVFYTGDAVPAWRNRLVVGTLVGQHVNVVTLTPPDGDLPLSDGGRRFDAGWLDDAYTATSHRALADVLGRVRHVEEGPDGGLYAITSNRDGRAQGEFPRERDDVLVRITQSG